MNEASLSVHMMTEYPQTICVLLSKIGAQQAARMLAHLPESLSLEVVMRLLRRVKIKKDVSKFVDRLFEKNIPVPMPNHMDRDPTEFVADIFSNFEQDIGEKLLRELGSRNMSVAIKVRNKMFKFCDLSRVAPSAIQMIISLAPKESLAIALKGEPSEVKSTFFSCMSERAARMLSEDIESFGPMPLKDIENAQKSIVCIAAKLIKDNKISVPDNNKNESIL
jgi:flagellar motor switch protein FliG